MNPPSRGFYVAHWGVLGWIETALKEIAIIAAIAGFFATNGLNVPDLGAHPKPLLLLLVAGLTFGMVFQTGFRVYQREIVSIAFAVTMLLGHAALLIGLMRAPEIKIYGIVFAVFMVLGDLVKSRWLAVSGYSEGGLSNRIMAIGVWLLIAVNVALGVMVAL